MMVTPLDVGRISVEMEGSDITVLDEVDSTNDWCRREISEGRNMPFVCIAERQLAGKGRRGRQWLSCRAGDITLSIAMQFDAALQEMGRLPLVVGLAVKNCLMDAGVTGTKLKWPNDVLIGDEKVAGVLIEAVPGVDTTMIIGIGVNVAEPETSITGMRATGLISHLGADADIDRDRLIVSILRESHRQIGELLEGSSSIHERLSEEFDDHDEIDVLIGDGSRHTGIMRGINDQGELLVQIAGEIRVFNSADISLRKRAAV